MSNFHCRASEIIENSERILFLCYMNWFGAHYALNKGLWDVAWKMLRYDYKSSD